ncbi:hypothetical protein I4U23_021930 [Adineta vaga]|nr:hypothetical protein I4U23_021930 [Adineta vaga]
MILLFLLLIYYVVPILRKYNKFRQDYRNVPSLPISNIPFIGNLHQLDRQQYIFSCLLLQMSKESQTQGKGLFCLWYSVWPMIFVSIFACRIDKYLQINNKEDQTCNLYPYISPCTLDIIAMGENLEAQIIEHRFNTFNDENLFKNDKEKTNKRRLVFLNSLLEQINCEQLSLDDIQEEGHDTTAAAINFTYDKERWCTIEDIQQMNYLDAVIKESMRVLPPVPFVMRQAQEDFICDNQLIRKDTTLYIFIMEVHYDSNVFSQLELFNPNRFYKSSETNDERSLYAFISFSTMDLGIVLVRIISFC